MTTNQIESSLPCGEQLRRFIKIGPQVGNHGAANHAEQLLNDLAKRAPSGSEEEKAAKKLIADLRVFFLGPTPPSHEAIEQIRSDLTGRIESLEHAVARYG